MSSQDSNDPRPTSTKDTAGAVPPRATQPRETEPPPAGGGSSWWIWLIIGIACLAVWLDVGQQSKDTSHSRSSSREYESWLREMDSRYVPLSEHEKRQRAVEMMGP